MTRTTTGPTPNKARTHTPDAAGAASTARILHLRATLGGSTCLRDGRPQRFCRLRTETAGTREKSKSLPHNKFTHINAAAASGIPAAPHLGMTCQPPPHAKHGQVLTLTDSTPHPAATGPASASSHSLRFREANRWCNRHRKARPIGGLIGIGKGG